MYHQGEYNDIQKAIYYYSLSAEQNNAKAYYNLAIIYETDKIVHDIKKAINCYLNAANLNFPNAQFNLGVFYYNGQYVSKDYKKSIHYLTLAANHNYAEAQYLLGRFYIEGEIIQPNINKGIYYLTFSSKNGFVDAHFALGYLYHEGMEVKRDIQKAVHYYKKASSLKNQFAKNNLAILYKNGFGNEIKPNINLSIEYLNETIRETNDTIAIHNLSHIYFYSQNKADNHKAIKLLLSSWKCNFLSSQILLCLSLIKEYGTNTSNIQNEMNKNFGISKNISSDIFKMMANRSLDNQKVVDILYESFKENVFVVELSYIKILCLRIPKDHYQIL